MKDYIACFAIVFATFVSGCTRDLPNEVTEPVSANDRIAGVAPLDSGLHVNIRNSAGSVVLKWAGVEDSVRWTLSRQTSGKNRGDAVALLNLIQLIRQPIGDTVRYFPQTPAGVVGYTVSADLAIGVPFLTPCIVEGVQGTTTVSDLGADLTMRNVHGVLVKRLNASCNIASLDGGVDCEVAIPQGGSCTITAVRGTIILKIPTNTSADITARTTNGTISSSYLTFTTINQQPSVLTGRLGTGNGQIIVETGEGSIILQGVLP